MNESIRLQRLTNQTAKENTEALNIYQNYLPDILLDISKIPLKMSNGKISTERTFANISSGAIKNAIATFAEITSRSMLYIGPAAKNTEYCSLVPLTMSAFKKYNDIGYNEWDKTDPLIKWALGFHLWEDIQPYLNKVPRPDEIKNLRKQALEYKGQPRAAIAWPNHSITLEDGTRWKGTNLARHILLQTWMANVEYRNKYMILDMQNWDNIPEAMDEVLKEEELPDLPF